MFPEAIAIFANIILKISGKSILLKYSINNIAPGIAIAKIEGTYQKEASDYINPNDIVKKLQDIAVNGLAED